VFSLKKGKNLLDGDQLVACRLTVTAYVAGGVWGLPLGFQPAASAVS